MSDSGDSSDCGPAPAGRNFRRLTRSQMVGNESGSSAASASTSTRNSNCNPKHKRRILMRVQYDDSDETSSDDNDGENIKPCSSRKSNRHSSKHYFNSSTDEEENGDDVDGSSSGSEIIPSASARGKRVQKKLVSEDEDVNTSTENANREEEAGFTSDSSSNEMSEKCPICLFTFRAQEIGSPATCDHTFCARCIEEWSRNVQTCPIDRLEFEAIVVRRTYHDRTVVREIKVQKTAAIDVDADEDDITPCEICNQTDREDVMLLCDTCNQGYHMDCLSTPLSTVPEGSWYCDNCFDPNDSTGSEDELNMLYDDMREMGIPENRLTITELYQPRILRTRQNERIRANILARTRSTRRTAANAPTNSDTVPQPSTSRGITASSSRTPRNRKATPRKTTKKRKTRKRKARARTYVVEYDVNNFDEKFEIKTKKKVVRRKRKSRKTKTKRGSRQSAGSKKLSASKRLAEKLGVVKPVSSVTSAIGASQSFSLFGGANDLEYFSDSDSGLANDIDVDMGDGTAVRTSVRFGNIVGHRNRKGIATSITNRPPDTNAGTADLLSSILDLQDRWHNASRRLENVQISSDGSLNLGITNTTSTEQQNNAETKSTSEANNTEVTEAPMYPRGGGGGGNNQNYSRGGGFNNRFNNNPSNYRGGGGGGGGNSYRNSTGGMESGNRGAGAGFNNSFGWDNSNYQNQNQNQFTPHNRDRFNRNQNQRNNRNSNQFNNRNNQNQNQFQNRNQNQNRPFPNRRNDSMNTSNENLDSMPVYGPENLQSSPEAQPNEPAEAIAPVDAPTPTLAPPPWNKTLFQLTAAYADDDEDDDNSNCPNFSIYSAESQQVAISSQESSVLASQPIESATKEDEHNHDEDLVQLGDDDEIPDAIDNSSLPYEPENPTGEDDVELPEENRESDKEESSAVSTPLVNNQDEQFLAEIKLPDDEPGSSVKKPAELELHDESDWEELNEAKEDEEKAPKETTDEVDGQDAEEKDEEGQKELDRSYTPCLDENSPNDDDEPRTPEIRTLPSDLNAEETQKKDNEFNDIETELISDDDTLNEQPQRKRDDDDKNREDRKGQQQFKKVSERQRERNYRSDKPRSPGRRRRSRSRTNDKENDHRRDRNDRKRVRRQELPRYDVRNVIAQRPTTNQDRFGRTRPARSRSRSRSRSGSRGRRRRPVSRSRSRSLTPKRARRSFSISLSPPPFADSRRSPARRPSFSPKRSNSRTRNRSRSPRRSPIRRRSRSVMQLRSRSNSVGKANGPRRNNKRSVSPKMRSRSRSRSIGFTPSPARSPSRRKGKAKKTKERKKPRKLHRRPSASPRGIRPRSLSPSKSRPVAQPSKKKRHRVSSKQRSPADQSWSPSPSPVPEYGGEHNASWTPPLKPDDNPRQDDEGKHKSKEKKKRTEKKKRKVEKRRDENVRKDKRRRRASEAAAADSPNVAPSKEVFASGNNILVSVSFNKETAAPQQTTVVTLPPTREEVVSTIRKSKDSQPRRRRKSKEKPVTRKHKKIDTQPVAIIDLERSPFQVTQPQSEVIVLTDSEGEGTEQRTDNMNANRDMHSEEDRRQQENSEKSPVLERSVESIPDANYEMSQFGPKTPPEPPVVKFALSAKNKQLKSRNPLHDNADDNESEPEAPCERTEIDNVQTVNKIGPNTPPDSGPCSPDAYDPFDPTKSPSMSPRSPPPAETSQTCITDSDQMHDSTDEGRLSLNTSQDKQVNPVDLVMSLVKPNTTQDSSISNESQFNNQTLDDSMLDQSEEQIQVLSNVLLPNKSQHIPSISSPVAAKSMAMSRGTGSSSSSRLNGGAGASNEDIVNEIESPYSPGSADYEDLFEPPADAGGISGTKRSRNKKSNKKEVFDNLFGSTSPTLGQPRMPSYTASTVRKHSKSTSRRNAKGKAGDDDVPNSAVDLQVKDKFLGKLNRQERVVEEVKLVLKPHYNRKHITKEDYKEIMRRSVPKICHSKSGEINPKKIQNLIEAYVKKFRQKNKLTVLNTNQVSSAVKCAAYLKKL